MTRTFTYTFKRHVKKEGTDGHKESDWMFEEVTLKKRVTDKMEERNEHKPGYAAGYFNRVLREKYGYKHSPVTACRITEI